MKNLRKFTSFRKIFFSQYDWFLSAYISIHLLNKRSHQFGTVHVGCFDLSDIIAQNRHRFYQSKTIKCPGNASGALIAYPVRYQQLFSSILQNPTRHARLTAIIPRALCKQNNEIIDSLEASRNDRSQCPRKSNKSNLPSSNKHNKKKKNISNKASVYNIVTIIQKI